MKIVKMEFGENPVSCQEAFIGCQYSGKGISKKTFELWKRCGEGKSLSSVHEKGNYFTWVKISRNHPCNTLVSGSAVSLLLWDAPNSLSDGAFKRIQTFPDDYNFMDQFSGYVCGMSVPPFMMQRISRELAMQISEKKVPPLKNGPWKIGDLDLVEKHGLKVFSCFCCGGGSSMGYKLAGYDVIGGVEIDKKIAAVYKKNMKPKYFYEMGVADFNKIPDHELPPELFGIDILDGSPPCSSFSMAGSREKKWGKKTYFREG